MENLDNIERSAYHKGEYVGYSDGVWMIRKTNSSHGNWSARHRDNEKMPLLFDFTLEGLSKQLKCL